MLNRKDHPQHRIVSEYPKFPWVWCVGGISAELGFAAGCLYAAALTNNVQEYYGYLRTSVSGAVCALIILLVTWALHNRYLWLKRNRLD